MASQDKGGFVADGEERVRNDERKRIAGLLAAKYAHEMAGAGFIKRWCLRWRMRKEVEVELKRKAPPRETLYATHHSP